MARRDITPLGITALALLEELGESYPYEMYQVLLKRSADRVVKLSTGTLYHTIDRLAERGLVRPICTERHGNRPERTAYEITPKGLKHCAIASPICWHIRPRSTRCSPSSSAKFITSPQMLP